MNLLLPEQSKICRGESFIVRLPGIYPPRWFSGKIGSSTRRVGPPMVSSWQNTPGQDFAKLRMSIPEDREWEYGPPLLRISVPWQSKVWRFNNCGNWTKRWIASAIVAPRSSSTKPCELPAAGERRPPFARRLCRSSQCIHSVMAPRNPTSCRSPYLIYLFRQAPFARSAEHIPARAPTF